MSAYEQSRTVLCANCSLPLPSEWSEKPDDIPCPECGSVYKHVEVFLVEAISSLKDYFSYDIHDRDYSSKRNPRKELLNRPTYSRADDRMRDELRIIDKYQNAYHKIITDQETGDVVYECHEPLTHHQSRGSARK